MLVIPRLHLETLWVNDDSGSQIVVVIQGLRDLHEPLIGRQLPGDLFFRFVRESPSLLGLGDQDSIDSQYLVLELLNLLE